MSDDAAMMPPPLPDRVANIPRQDVIARLSGLDPRRNAFRSDLASTLLAGRVEVPQFVEGEARQIMRASVPLRRRPAANAALDTEALFGETLVVYDIADGWAWVQLDRDGYVGYLPADTLGQDVQEPTHRVRSIGTFLYPVPDIKAPPLMHLSLNAQLSVAEGDDKFCLLTTGGFVYTRHIAPMGRFVRDYVSVAEMLIGTPYLWGGRSRIGIDCSGLVQNALDAAGVLCPRDSDMQEAEVGTSIAITPELEDLKRGDLLFWPGHVGMMVDGLMLLHANAHHMAVVVETLPEAADRIAKAGSPLRTIKRIGDGAAT
ncbi:MAG: C40 family peptidase [Hyphomicrobiaceae bacterium]|jgi:cell wall-associated NlpC family hydrolase|nr:C40 family peptidase [Hyphomicrobiaceae bacterium]